VIIDPELRDIFKIEFEENIQILNDELMKLEINVFDFEALSKLMRVAHSMKGGARMIGLTEVVKLAHFFEDMLGAVKKDGVELNKNDFNRMYKALDIITALVDEAVTSEPIKYDIQSAVDLVINNSEIISEEKETSKEELSQEIISVVSSPNQPVSNEPAHITAFNIETIRVPSERLDALMNLSGELTVSKIQLALRVTKLEDIENWVEEVSREISAFKGCVDSNPNRGSLVSKDFAQSFDKTKLKIENLLSSVSQFKEGLFEDNSRLDFVAYEFEEVIKNLRMLHLSNIFNLYPRMVRDISQELGKEVNFFVEGAGITADKKVLEEMKDPLMHMIRNSVDHGIESPEKRESVGKQRTGTIKLSAKNTSSTIIITLEDDGQGLNEESIRHTALKKKLYSEEDLSLFSSAQIHKLIFSPGFSTSKMITDVSGRGVGMEVVQTNIERLKGKINIESSPGSGCKFIIELPLTLATLRVMIAMVKGSLFAIPIEYIDTSISMTRSDIFSMEGRDTIVHNGQAVSVVKLESLLELKNNPKKNDGKGTELLQCILISSLGERIGLIVDSLIDEQEVLVKPLGVMLKRVRNVSGSTILGSGEVCIILNPNDLVKSVKSKPAVNITDTSPSSKAKAKKSILLVEDSITTRTQEKRILESAGFSVITAVDGVDGFQKLTLNEIDGVVSDIEMPNMDGLALSVKIRNDKKYLNLPIVLVTSLSTDEQKKKGLESGANAYLTKSGFDQRVLIETLDRLL
jgi:two-component system chemotaxis sensor kinase CheA